MKSCKIFLLLKIRTMATNFSPCKGSYVLNQFPSNVMFGMNGFHVSASGAIQGHHGPFVFIMSALVITSYKHLLHINAPPKHFFSLNNAKKKENILPANEFVEYIGISLSGLSLYPSVSSQQVLDQFHSKFPDSLYIKDVHVII